ncbi:uncharacterized protein LOC111881133 [Lactuca sativa]|uniref:Uncharacterized protein n=1 Tax=Lactuca sativa TaxID=4236 RepID=A0A9R1VJ85_LACSA|nr:uncharacterized protein LOC111881133 [Lactuca sativa]KAJ0205673.1 hypothetical protein LSAT_V11C500252260 [Lactuca sativa]
MNREKHHRCSIRSKKKKGGTNRGRENCSFVCRHQPHKEGGCLVVFDGNKWRGGGRGLPWPTASQGKKENSVGVWDLFFSSKQKGKVRWGSLEAGASCKDGDWRSLGSTSFLFWFDHLNSKNRGLIDGGTSASVGLFWLMFYRRR